jgi:hypothetical protein
VKSCVNDAGHWMKHEGRAIKKKLVFFENNTILNKKKCKLKDLSFNSAKRKNVNKTDVKKIHDL